MRVGSRAVASSVPPGEPVNVMIACGQCNKLRKTLRNTRRPPSPRPIPGSSWRSVLLMSKTEAARNPTAVVALGMILA